MLKKTNTSVWINLTNQADSQPNYDRKDEENQAKNISQVPEIRQDEYKKYLNGLIQVWR